MPGRDLMLVTAFAVILATVLIQGTTLGLVIRLLRPGEDQRTRPPLDLVGAEAVVVQAQYAGVQAIAYAANGALMHPRLLEKPTADARHSQRVSRGRTVNAIEIAARRRTKHSAKVKLSFAPVSASGHKAPNFASISHSLYKCLTMYLRSEISV